MDVDYEMLGTEKVVISLKDFEMMLDIIAYDEAKARKEEAFPAAFAARLIKGENRLKAYRTYRKLSQAALAKAASVPQGLISEIETGKKTGSINTLKALADVLSIEVDDLL
ncbi:MAG: helix-turn-helix transcriptional regulator [Alphaproteobacteria bacterium]|nr:helix-turn-helix transcriptional regulator [Alphaproteobacteria bacterium]